MKRLSILILTFALLATPLLGADWDFDKAHSHVGFKASHMVLSRVSGQFNKFDGKVTGFDGENVQDAQVEVTIDAASIDTDNENRDAHLRTGDFLLVDSFPNITFVSTRITPLNGNDFKIIGDLTIRGVTKEVTLDATYNGKITDPQGNSRAGFSASTEIDRRDFGTQFNKVLETGGLVVGNEVEINLEAEIIQQR
jgi:polyisoprenoid-binding protein YceI